MAIDPICNMEVDNDNFKLTLKDKTYYFCSKGCLEKFKHNPDFINNHIFDLVIIGGGPAGLTAAVYASMLKIDTFVIAKDIGGQAIDSTKIKNYMGYDFITGKELVEKFQNQFVHTNYLDHKIDEVIEIIPDNKNFIIKTKLKNRIHTKTIIIATGMKQRKLGIPGEKEFQRKGIFYSAVQDISILEGKKVAVIGGGNSGIQTAIKLKEFNCDITLVTNGNLIADKKDIKQLKNYDKINIIEHHNIIEIQGNENVEKIIIQSEESLNNNEISCNAVFIQVGQLPNTEFCSNLIKINSRGEIIINQDCSTNINGIYACGDVTNAYGKRIIIASGEGAKAALRIRELLLEK